jgi:hypothetical protein
MVLAENERTLMRIKSVHDVEAATLPVTGLPNHLNHLSDGNANFAREGSNNRTLRRWCCTSDPWRATPPISHEPSFWKATTWLLRTLCRPSKHL